MYRRITRRWTSELRHLMFPEHARHDDAQAKGWGPVVVDCD